MSAARWSSVATPELVDVMHDLRVALSELETGGGWRHSYFGYLSWDSTIGGEMREGAEEEAGSWRVC